MAIDPITGTLIAAHGLQALGGAITGYSARRAAEKRRRRRLKALEPVEAQIQQMGFGPSQSEGRIEQAVTNRTLRSLARRGVLQSSFAPGEVAAAVAPIEEQRQARLQDARFRLAAAKEAIEADTDIPGTGAIFGETLGDVGGFLALRAGIEDARRANKEQLELLKSLFQQGTDPRIPYSVPGAYQQSIVPSFGPGG